MRYKLVVALAYIGALAWFAYSSDEVIPDWIAFTAIFVAPFFVGFLVGRLWVVVLPAIVVLLAIPAGQAKCRLRLGWRSSDSSPFPRL